MFTKLKFDFIATVGRVEIKMVNDREMAKVSVAANSYHTDDAGAKVKRTHWVDCVAWNPAIVDSIRKHVAKGATVNLVGEVQQAKRGDGDNAEYYTNFVITEFPGIIIWPKDGE